MTIYEFGTTLAVSVGSTATVSLPIRGGLLQQFWIQANTASTVFRANLVDDHSRRRMDWGFHTGQLNEVGLRMPMVNKYTINITNVSPNDIFKVLLAVQE